MIEYAHIIFTEPLDGHDDEYFAAVDGDNQWIGVSRKPEPGDEQAIRDLLDPPDGGTLHLRATRAWVAELEHRDWVRSVYFGAVK